MGGRRKMIDIEDGRAETRNAPPVQCGWRPRLCRQALPCQSGGSPILDRVFLTSRRGCRDSAAAQGTRAKQRAQPMSSVAVLLTSPRRERAADEKRPAASARRRGQDAAERRQVLLLRRLAFPCRGSCCSYLHCRSVNCLLTRLPGHSWGQAQRRPATHGEAPRTSARRPARRCQDIARPTIAASGPRTACL